MTKIEYYDFYYHCRIVLFLGRGHSPIGADPPRHLLEWIELFVVDKGELGDEVVKVRLGPDRHEAVKVVHIDVDEDAVQSCQDLFAHRYKVFGKRDVVGEGIWPCR